MHPCPNVVGHELGPCLIPLPEGPGLACYFDVLPGLAHGVGVMAVYGPFPFLVGVAELVPSQRGPVITLAARTCRARLLDLALAWAGSPLEIIAE